VDIGAVELIEQLVGRRPHGPVVAAGAVGLNNLRNIGACLRECSRQAKQWKNASADHDVLTPFVFHSFRRF